MNKEEAEKRCSKYFQENCYKENRWADTHDLVAMYLDGYNKANEWHYVKDGDLPKEIKEYFVYKIDGYGCKSIQVMQFNNQHCWCANCQNEIKAWKEIVLPEESK